MTLKALPVVLSLQRLCFFCLFFFGCQSLGAADTTSTIKNFTKNDKDIICPICRKEDTTKNINNWINKLLKIKTAINCLVCISFAIKNGMKKFGFFEKKTYVLPVGYLTCSVK